MSDEPQPEYRWAPLPEKPKRRGRVWLIVGLSVAAVAIVGVLLFLLIPRSGDPAPTSSPSPSASPTVSPTASATPSPSATADEPADPAVTPPPVPDPDLDTFAAQVAPPLDDAQTGLSMVSDSGGQDAVLIVEQLQQDAERLAGTAAPSSIADDWNEAVTQYAARLAELSTAYQNGSGQQGALSAAETALQSVRALVGL